MHDGRVIGEHVCVVDIVWFALAAAIMTSSTSHGVVLHLVPRQTPSVSQPAHPPPQGSSSWAPSIHHRQQPGAAA